MKQLIYDLLKNDNLSPMHDDDIANNSIKIVDGEVILSGNKRGLIMLADYIVNIALLDTNTHIHLDLDNFFDNADSQLIIELKNE